MKKKKVTRNLRVFLKRKRPKNLRKINNIKRRRNQMKTKMVKINPRIKILNQKIMKKKLRKKENQTNMKMKINTLQNKQNLKRNIHQKIKNKKIRSQMTLIQNQKIKKNKRNRKNNLKQNKRRPKNLQQRQENQNIIYIKRKLARVKETMKEAKLMMMLLNKSMDQMMIQKRTKTMAMEILIRMLLSHMIRRLINE